MNYTVLTESFSPPEIDKREIFRYMGVISSDNDTEKLTDLCLDEIKGSLKYNVCYCVTELEITNNTADFGCTSITSDSLSKALVNCERAVIFSATIGIEADRLIAKYGKLSPSKALCFQAIGAERIEALCDEFCNKIKSEYGSITPRFSPGYGDLPLSFQRDIFGILGCEKRIGLTLNESLIMSPTKSVTAIIGIK